MNSIFIKKQIFMFMIIYNFRLTQFNHSHFSFFSVIIFNSPLINYGNFPDINNEPLNLSLKK